MVTTAFDKFLDGLPEVRWEHGDDLCDHAFQRIGSFTNPYIGKTITYRWCCIWAELGKQFPDFIQETKAYYDENVKAYLPTPIKWDSAEMDMPRYLWYRQLQTETGLSLQEIRGRYYNQEPPKRVVKERTVPEPVKLTMAQRIAVEVLAQEVANAQAKVAALLAEIGVDPTRNWHLTAAGLEETDAASH